MENVYGSHNRMSQHIGNMLENQAQIPQLPGTSAGSKCLFEALQTDYTQSPTFLGGSNSSYIPVSVMVSQACLKLCMNDNAKFWNRCRLTAV